MRTIDADALLERACNLEAQALAYVGKIVNDESKIEEQKIWFSILAERTAFKQDIFDAPTIEPEIVRCKNCIHGVDYYHDGDCYCSNPKWGLMYFVGSWEFYCADAERRTDEDD